MRSGQHVLLITILVFVKDAEFATIQPNVSSVMMLIPLLNSTNGQISLFL